MKTDVEKAAYMKTYLAAYRAKPGFKDRNAAYARKHNKTSKRKEYLRKWNQLPEAVKAAKARRSSEKGKLQNRTRVHQYRARKKKVDYPDAKTGALKVASAKKCFYCGCRVRRPEIEHLNPMVRTGVHASFNLVPSCGKCNRSKGGKDPNEFIRSGQLLIVFQDPIPSPLCPPAISTPTQTTATTETSIGFNPTKDGDAPW